MKRRNLLFFITFLLIFSGVTLSAQTTWYVNDNAQTGDGWSTSVGNDANTGTSPADPKATITATMALASSGDRIMVDNGEYLVSSLVIKNGVKVVGASPDNTVLRVQATGAPIQMASNSELWNCKLYRAIPNVAGGAPTITLSNQAGASNIHIENCFFYKNRTAIYLDAGTNTVIARNRFDDNRTGILVDVYGNTNQEGLIIRDNEINNSRSFGIIFLGTADDPNQSGYVHAKIDNNIFTGNLAGGMENNNANASTSILLRNNWFGHTPADVNPMRTNGGFNVADHDGTGFTNPTFTDNGTLLGASYPNDRSGANTNGFVVLTDADAAPMGAGPTLFVTSTNPAFEYYTNVQDAINASSAGATVTVPDGTFREDVTINKQLTVSGTSQNGTIIKGLYYGDANAVSVNAGNATITNLTVTRDYGMTDTEWNTCTKNQGITLNANGDTVRNVTITGNRNGLYINNRQGSVVQNNNIISNRTGIQMANNISNATITNNIIDNNFTHGLMINTDLGPVDATNVIIKNNQIKGNWYSNLYLHGANTITAPGANFGCNDYGTNAPTTNAAAAGEPGYASQLPSQLGGTPPANNFADMAGSQVISQATAPWLVNATDADIAMSGFQRSNALSIVPVTGTLSPANNDYRIVANAIGCAQSGDVVTLSGTFDWNTSEAKAAWALGTNGVSEGSTSAVYSGNGDDYTITPQENTDNVTITANTQGGATIQGPGDLANVTLESALFFNDNKATSSYKNWTISNLIFKDLDVSVIADINGSHNITAMDSFKFTNNQVYIPADLNATVAPADNYQNIGLHLAFGKGQQITNNTFYIDGTGVSDSANDKYSNSNAIQSANSGNQVYDGLKIDNNQIHVTGVPDANPARIVGIWENSNDQHSNIEIKNNTFINDDAGNTYDKNNQLAFRITSFSDATHQVSYRYNEVNGWNRAFEFLGDPLATYQPNLYYSAAQPVVLANNLIQNVAYGIGVHKRGGSTNTGAPAIISNNSFTNIAEKAVFYDSTGNIDANCNWWGTTSLNGIDSLIQISNGATISRGQILTSGGNNVATGFDPTGACEGVVQNLTAGTTHPTIQDAIDNAVPGDTIYAPAGVYNEAVNVNKKIILEGAQHGIDPRPVAGSSRSIDNVNETIVIAPGAQRVINIAADSVTVDGFELKHTNLITYGEDVVSCDASPLKNGLVITNNIITNANDEGIQLRGASNVLIEKNYVYGSRGDGINLSSNPTGQNQKIYDNEIDSSNSPYGSIYLYGVNDVEIKGNYIHGFNNGMAIGEGSDPNNYVSNIHIHNNEIHSEFNHYIATLYGIAIANSGTNHVMVDSNTIITNTNDAIGPSHLAIIRVNDNPSDISINDNYLKRPQDSAYIFVANTVTNEVNANCNWYGASSYNDIAQRISGTGAINAIPYLIDSTDNSTDIGFTPTATACYAPVHNITQGRDFNTIQSAIASPITVDGDTIMIEDGTYTDQVLVNKSVTIKSMPGADVVVDDTAGAITGKPTLFDISVNNVTIDSLHFKVDLSRLKSAIIASGAAIDTITIKNNLIEPYGVPSSGTYGDRNAVSVNYGGSTNYRNATGGVANIIFEGNTVTANGGNSFRAAICADEAGGTFSNNTLQSMNQDVLVRFANNGPVTVTDNHINGGGVEVSDHNAQAGLITISGNVFDGTATGILPVPNPLLRLKQNNHAIPTVVSNNTFNNVVWGISLENYNADTIYSNTFTPLSTATAFRHITVNTKLLNSTAIASIAREAIDADIHDNTFNGLSGNNTGKALAFYNHWSDGGAQYGTFKVANNTFNAGIANYIYLDTLNGISTGDAAVTALYPEYPDDNAQPTTTGYWTRDIPDSNNLYAVGGSSAIAYSAMNSSQRYDSLYSHIYDKVDNASVGRVVFVMPVHNLTHPADYASIQEAVDAALAGDTIVADAGVYMESVTVNKSLDIRGAQYGNPVMGRTFGSDAESEVRSPAGKSAFKITAGNNTSIRGFSLEGSAYGGAGKGVEEWSSLTGTHVSENFIHNYTGSIGVSLAAGSQGFDISENDIRNNYAGVYLSENAHDGSVHNNIIADNVNGSNDQGAAIAAEANNNNININNNTITNNGKALWIWSGLGTTLSNFNFTHNEVNNNTASVVNNLNTTTLNAVCNWYGDIAGPATTAGITTALNARTNNWLVYGDADPATIGFQTQASYTVASQGNNDAINNDYRILSNAIGCAQKGDVITLDGTFDWSGSDAIAAWAKGNNGVDEGGTGDDNKDDWAILLPTDVDSVTLTGINNATVNGPGDLAQANLEAFIASYAGHNRQWDINNLTIKDIDAAILFDNGATVNVSDSLKIHDNTFYIPKDETADANQNIGIDLANGLGQEVYNNTFIVDGSGQSNGAQKSQTVVLQSTTTGGTLYNGLKIHDNTVRVTGVPNATDAAYIIGFWDNGQNKNADIQLYNNKFMNDDAGNIAANNRQLAFRVTSRSGADKTVTYNHNEITGFNRAIDWIGDPFSSYGAPNYEADATPVLIENNKIDNVTYGVSVRKAAGQPNNGAPAVINNNSFTGVDSYAVSYNGESGDMNADCNWWGTTTLTGIDSLIQVVNGGSIIHSERLVDNGNSASIGFEPSGACEGVVENITQNTHHATIQEAIDSANANDTIYVPAGIYNESVNVDKALTIWGAQHGVDPRPVAASSRTISGPEESIVKGPGNARVFNITNDSVTIDGLQVQHVNHITYGEDAISNQAGIAGISLLNNIIYDANDEGIQMRGANDLMISHNYIYQSQGDGINLSSNPTGQNQKIYDNEIDSSNSPYGSIYLYAVKDVEIKGNYIHGYNNGIAIGEGSDPNNFAKDISVHNNDIHIEFTHYISQLYAISIANNGTDNIVIDSNSIITNTNDAIGPLHLATIRINDNPSNVSINDNYLQRPQDSAYIYVASTVSHEVNAECNWFGSTSYDSIQQRIAGTGAINVIPYLINGTDNSTDIGFMPDTNACYAPVHNITQGRDFNTIQSAIDWSGTQNGDTLTVEPGIYAENVVVTKLLDIRGANYGINPNTGTRGDESIIVPAANDTSAGSIIYLNTTASGSSINGFTLDGDNTLVSGGSDINGADANTSEAISAYDGISNVSISNNIVRSLAYAGIDLYNYTNGGSATSGNAITGNKISNITSGLYGIGVLIYNNAYTEVGNNVFDSVRTGIQTGNFSKADPGNSHGIHDNVITNVSHRGIFHNLHYSQATSFDIANNNISGAPGAGNVDGIMVSSIQNNAGAHITDNIIADVTNGYNLWNNPTSDTITVTGGNINNAVRGIFANNYAGYSSNAVASAYIVDGVSIQDATQASVYVQDSGNTTGAAVSLNVRNNAQLSNTAKGIILQGANAKLQFDGTLPATFTGQAWYIDQISNGTDVPNTDIDASEVATDIPVDNSVAGQQDFNTVQLIEGKANDKDDDTSLGQVYFKMPVLNVNTNRKYPDIQSAIAAASPGDSLFADKWIYKEDVVINKDNIKLSGVLNAADTSEVIGLISTNPSILITANNVSVSNLMVTRDGNDPAHFLNHPKTQGIAFNSRTGTHLINLYVHGNRTGIDMNNAPNTTIEFCDVDFNRTGIMVNNNCDGSVIRNNNITNNWTEGLLLNIMSAGVTNNLVVRHNKIAGNWYSNVENRHTGTLIDLTANSWNTDSVWATANPAGEASYNAVWPVEYGGSGMPVAAQGYFISGATDRVDYTAWLPYNVVNNQPAGSPGFLPDTTDVYVDEASPVLAGMTKLERASDRVADGGTIHFAAPVIHSVLISGKELTLTGNDTAYTLDGIVYNGTGNQLHLTDKFTVTDTFNLANGIVKVESNGALNIDASTAHLAVNASPDNYVDGPMTVSNVSGDFLFPVGKGGKAAYAKLVYQGGSGNFTAEYFPQSYSDLTLGGIMGGVSDKEYWNIERTSGDYTGQVQLYSMDTAYSGVDSNSIVAHFDGNAWIPLGQSAHNDNPFAITSDSVVNTFSPFTFGSKGVMLSLKVYLQGAYNATLGRNKNVTAAWAGILQANATAQPYNTAAFNYAGTEAVSANRFQSTAGDTDVIDWVLLQLKDATNNVVAARAALLLENGNVVDTDGVSPVFFTAPKGSYYVNILHRNHLPVRSAAMLNLSAAAISYDFTTAQSMAYQDPAVSSNAAMAEVNGTFVMWGGNGASSTNAAMNSIRMTGTFTINDFTYINQVLNGNTSLNSAYSNADYNMDGQVRNTGALTINDYIFLYNITGGNTIINAHQ